MVPSEVFGGSKRVVWRLHSPRLEALNALPDIVPQIDLPLLLLRRGLLFEEVPDGDVELILPSGLIGYFEPGEVMLHGRIGSRIEDDPPPLERGQREEVEVGGIGCGHPELFGQKLREDDGAALRLDDGDRALLVLTGQMQTEETVLGTDIPAAFGIALLEHRRNPTAADMAVYGLTYLVDHPEDALPASALTQPITTGGTMQLRLAEPALAEGRLLSSGGSPSWAVIALKVLQNTSFHFIV